MPGYTNGALPGGPPLCAVALITATPRVARRQNSIPLFIFEGVCNFHKRNAKQKSIAGKQLKGGEMNVASPKTKAEVAAGRDEACRYSAHMYATTAHPPPRCWMEDARVALFKFSPLPK